MKLVTDGTGFTSFGASPALAASRSKHARKSPEGQEDGFPQGCVGLDLGVRGGDQGGEAHGCRTSMAERQWCLHGTHLQLPCCSLLQAHRLQNACMP